MALNANEVKVLVTARDECSKVLGGIKGNLQSLGKVAALGAAAGIGVAAVALASFAKAAAEEEVGIARLNQAIGNLDAAHKGSAAQVEEVVRQREKLAYADDEIRDSLSLLVAQTSDYEEAVRRQAVAMDFARGAGIDLQTASKLLGKVSDENISVLSRYGIVVREGADAQEVLATVQGKFAGQAAAYAGTAAGAWERFGNQMDNVKETLGAALLPIITKVGSALADFLTAHMADIEAMTQKVSDLVARGFAALGDWFDKHQDQIRSGLKAIAKVVGELWSAFKSGLETIMPTFKALFNFITSNRVTIVAAIAAIGAAILLALGPGALAVAAIIGFIALIGLIRAHWDDIKAKTLEIWDIITGFLDERFGWMRALFETTFAAIKRIVEFVWTDIQTIFQFALDTIKNAFGFWKDIFSGDWKAAWQHVKDQFGIIWDLIAGLFTNRLKLIGDVATYALAVLKNVFFGGFNAVKDAVAGVMDVLRDFLTDHWREIVAVALGILFPAAGGLFYIVTHWTEVKDRVLAVVSELGSKLIGGFQLLVAFILGIVGDLVGKMYNLGRDMIQRMIDGISSMAGSLLDMARDLAGQIADLLNPANWLGSPKGLQNWLPFYFEESVRNMERAAARLLPIAMPPLLELAQAKAQASYQMGTPFVPSTGIYTLHRGEAVLTAQQSRQMAGGADQGRTIVIKEFNVVLPDVRDPDVFARRFGPAMSRWLGHLQERVLRGV